MVVVPDSVPDEESLVVLGLLDAVSSVDVVGPVAPVAPAVVGLEPAVVESVSLNAGLSIVQAEAQKRLR